VLKVNSLSDVNFSIVMDISTFPGEQHIRCS